MHGSDGGERSFACGLVIRAIGFESAPLSDVPFDAARRLIPTRDARVLDGGGEVCAREDASGWGRRGPCGIIVASRLDALDRRAPLGGAP